MKDYFSQHFILPKVENKKDYLRRGFAIFSVATIALFIQFLLYLLRSTYMEEMTIGCGFYYLLSAFSHAASFTLVLYLLLYVPLVFFRKCYKIGLWLLSIFYFLLLLLGYVNGEVFKIYKFHINGFVIHLLFGKGASEIFVFSNTLIIGCIVIAFFSILLFGLLIFVCLRHYKRISKHIKWFVSAIFVSLLLSHFIHAYAAATNITNIQDVSVCLPQFYPLTANELMMRMGIINKNNLYVKNIGGGNLNYPLHPIQVEKNKYSKKNIIFLYIDSWNYRTLSNEITPNIMKMARKSSVFTNHLSSSNGTRGSIFGSFFSISSTYWNNFESSGIQPVFVNTLLKEGYQVQAFPSANLIDPPFYRMVFGNIKDLNTETTGETPFDRDNKLTENYLNYLDKQDVSSDKPFFSFLFYDLAHAISIPDAYNKRFQPACSYADYLDLSNSMNAAPFFNLYKNCVYHIDLLVGQVLNKLEKKGLLENTIIVITGDHGQEFNENRLNYWGHGSNYSDAQIKVPFIFYQPGRKAGFYTYRTSHYDIVPTIMSQCLGVKNAPADYSMGYSLFSKSQLPYHLVGDDLDYAFIFDNMIYEKKPSGQVVLTNRTLRPLKKGYVNSKQLLDAIKLKNRFLK